MNIGLVTQSYYPMLGGVTEHVWHLGRELQRRGHRVTVVTGRIPPRLIRIGIKNLGAHGLPVIRLGWQIPFLLNGANSYVTVGWKLGRQLQRIEAAEKFDVLHVQSPLDPVFPLIASKATRTPKVGTYHTARQPTGSPIEKIPVIFRRVFLDAIGKIQAHLAVSRAAEEFVHRYFPQVSMTIIPNGVDTDRFRPEAAVLPPFDDDVLTILFVGRMDPRKGAKYLLLALPYLEEKLERYRLVVVGAGWLQKYYDAYIPLRLRPRVVFTGYVAPADLPGYYARADIYCSPATGNESFGIVLLEAMAAGTPIVASDIDGYRWVVEPGQEGLLVPPRSPRHLANAIIGLANDPDRRKRMGEAGRRKALNYSWSKIVDQLVPIYERVAQTKST